MGHMLSIEARNERRAAANSSSIVHSYREAAAIAGFGLRTLERLLADGDGPAVIMLSPRRRGIADAALRAWLQARTRKPPSAVA